MLGIYHRGRYVVQKYLFSFTLGLVFLPEVDSNFLPTLLLILPHMVTAVEMNMLLMLIVESCHVISQYSYWIMSSNFTVFMNWISGPMSWVQRQMIIGVNPRSLLNQLVTDGTQIPQQIDDLTLWKIIMNMMSEPPRRQKLRHINTLVDVVRLLKGAKKIIVLTGAGVSIKLNWRCYSQYTLWLIIYKLWKAFSFLSWARYYLNLSELCQVYFYFIVSE